MQKATKYMTRFYNEHHNSKLKFAVGDKVWLSSKDIETARPAKKLDDMLLGDNEITEKLSRSAYRLKLPKTMQIHPVINISRLRPYKADTIEGRVAPPPPKVVVRGEEQYEVEEIINSRLRRGKLQYLIKWKGYTRENNTWEPEENVKTGATGAIRDFYRRNPGAPRRLNTVNFADIGFRPYEDLTKTDAQVNWADGDRGVWQQESCATCKCRRPWFDAPRRRI